MKHHLNLTLCMLALALASLTQAQKYAKTDWESTTTGPNDNLYLAAVPLPSGDVIWVGNKENNSNRTDIWVRRIAQDGTVLWTTTFVKPGAAGNAFAATAALGPTGNIIIGARVTGNATTYDTYILKIDDSGNKIADKTIDLYDWDLLDAMRVGSSGNVVFATSTSGVGQYAVTKLDPNLNVTWTTYLGNVGQDFQYANRIDLTPNGDVLVAGLIFDGVQRDVELDRLSPGGTVLYSNVYGDATLSDGSPVVISGQNAKTYLAYVFRESEPNHITKLLQIDQTGSTVWTANDVDIYGPEITETPSGDVVIAGATFPAVDVSSQKFAKFTSTGAVLWVTALDTPNCDHNFVRQLKLGPDDLIYSTAHFSEPGVTGSGWLVNCLSSDGAQVYQWKLHQGPDTYAFPDAMVPLAGGALLIGGEVGSTLDDDAHLERIQAEFNVFPLSTTIRLGRLNGGNLLSLINDDDNVYDVCKFLVPNQSTPPVNVEFNSFVPANYPANNIEFHVVSKSSTSGLTQNIELWNWTTNAWERSTLKPMLLTEQSTTVVGAVADTIQTGTRLVRARVRMAETGLLMSSNWCVQFDQATWFARP